MLLWFFVAFIRICSQVVAHAFQVTATTVSLAGNCNPTGHIHCRRYSFFVLTFYIYTVIFLLLLLMYFFFCKFVVFIVYFLRLLVCNNFTQASHPIYSKRSHSCVCVLHMCGIFFSAFLCSFFRVILLRLCSLRSSNNKLVLESWSHIWKSPAENFEFTHSKLL